MICRLLTGTVGNVSDEAGSKDTSGILEGPLKDKKDDSRNYLTPKLGCLLAIIHVQHPWRAREMISLKMGQDSNKFKRHMWKSFFYFSPPPLGRLFS